MCKLSDLSKDSKDKFASSCTVDKKVERNNNNSNLGEWEWGGGGWWLP